MFAFLLFFRYTNKKIGEYDETYHTQSKQFYQRLFYPPAKDYSLIV